MIKPRIRKRHAIYWGIPCTLWYCAVGDEEEYGFGFSPETAYALWERKHFWVLIWRRVRKMFK